MVGMQVHAKREPWTATTLDPVSRDAVFLNEPTSVPNPNTLWFNRPSTHWNKALPIGNGSMGAMVFGGIQRDVIQFNHIDLWLPPSCDPALMHSRLPDKTDAVNRVRDLLFEGKPYEAHEIVKNELLVYVENRYQGMGSYVTFALLNFEYDFLQGSKTVDGYLRALDMDTGIARSQFALGDTRYHREVFIDSDLNVMAIRMQASGNDVINLRMHLSRPSNFEHQEPETGSLGKNRIYIKGTAHGQKITEYDTSYTAVAEAHIEQGDLSSENGVITIRNAKSFTITLACATNYDGDNPLKPLNRDLTAVCESDLNAFHSEGWNQRSAKTSSDHQNLFNRVNIRLGPKASNDIPTDLRLARSSTKDGILDTHFTQYDGLLESQLFQLGRYILIASSRGQKAPPLAGIWNSELMPQWSGDYHQNINTQMYYWPVDVANLGELHHAYFDMMERQLPFGRRLASEMFGCRGAAVSVLHGNRYVILPSMPPRAFWLMGGVWSATHIMEHVRFSGDIEFLRERGYPLLKEFLLFGLDWTVEHPKTGKWVAGPSASPENVFAANEADRDAKRWGHEDVGTGMDQQLMWQLCTDFLEASELLGIQQDPLISEVRVLLWNLETTKVTPDGRVMEWSRDYTEGEPYHRHVSHLFALYPGYQYTPETAPDITKAAKRTLELRSSGDRGAGKVGWSIPWISALYARLNEPAIALEFLLRYRSEKVIHSNLMGKGGNALEQSAGMTAAVAEMLLQSHKGFIELLPALPEQWSEGEVSGLMARGGFEISMRWKNGNLIEASIFSKRGMPCTILYRGQELMLELDAGERRTLNSLLK